MGNQNLIIGSVLSAKTKKGLIEIEIEKTQK